MRYGDTEQESNMANKYSLWGFGNFAIQDTNLGNLVIFPDSYCRLYFERVSEVSENLDHEEDEDFYGYRAMLDVKIKSVGATTYRSLLKMVQILDTRRFILYPFYSSTIPRNKQLVLNEAYDMREDSDFGVNHYEQFLQSGQYVDITFRAKKLVQERPRIHNDEDLLTVVGDRFFVINRNIKV